MLVFVLKFNKKGGCMKLWLVPIALFACCVPSILSAQVLGIGCVQTDPSNTNQECLKVERVGGGIRTSEVPRQSSIQTCSAWMRPVVFGRLTQGFSETHHGLDIYVRVGTQILVFLDGKIKKVGIDRNGGSFVVVDHGGSVESVYGHLSRIDVHIGQIVYTGDLLGFSGGEPGTYGAGISTGPHLHFEVRVSGRIVDPEFFLRSGGGCI
ncbi:TPA: hypothetical protein DD617_04045 [Candidatus Uhrbacteria bacterium]|jgi:murein DD-endopeptidase MepM/ murein hydrolase activator NlpD|nr:hypothetical protein [Candidatus Uhrbacteria bacterium]